jgi:hypothetical protein
MSGLQIIETVIDGYGTISFPVGGISRESRTPSGPSRLFAMVERGAAVSAR